MIYAVAPELKADSISFAEHVDFAAMAASRYITDRHVPFDTNINLFYSRIEGDILFHFGHLPTP